MPGVDDISRLAALPLFEGLDDDDLRRLNERLVPATFPAGTRVMSAEQPGEALYILLEGSVKIQIVGEDGTETTLALLGPGDTVGEMSLVESAVRSANVVTLQDSRFLWMDREAFLGYLDRMPRLTRNLVQQLSGRLRIANQQIQALSRLDVAGRVARQILHFAEQYGKRLPDGGIALPLPLTQSDVAEIVGATRERVNYVMVTFKREGLLSVDAQHRITVHAPDRLADHCR